MTFVPLLDAGVLELIGGVEIASRLLLVKLSNNVQARVAQSTKEALCILQRKGKLSHLGAVIILASQCSALRIEDPGVSPVPVEAPLVVHSGPVLYQPVDKRRANNFVAELGLLKRLSRFVNLLESESPRDLVVSL